MFLCIALHFALYCAENTKGDFLCVSLYFASGYLGPWYLLSPGGASRGPALVRYLGPRTYLWPQTRLTRPPVPLAASLAALAALAAFGGLPSLAASPGGPGGLGGLVAASRTLVISYKKCFPGIQSPMVPRARTLPGATEPVAGAPYAFPSIPPSHALPIHHALVEGRPARTPGKAAP